MKNKGLIIILSLIAILVAIILIFGNNKNDYYKEITYSEYKELINNDETFILYIHQTGCSHCSSFTPVLKKVLNKYKINNCYSINLSDMSKDEAIEFGSNTSVSGTPTIIFYNDGIEDKYDHVVGVKTEKVLTNKFKNKGFINN